MFFRKTKKQEINGYKLKHKKTNRSNVGSFLSHTSSISYLCSKNKRWETFYNKGEYFSDFRKRTNIHSYLKSHGVKQIKNKPVSPMPPSGAGAGNQGARGDSITTIYCKKIKKQLTLKRRVCLTFRLQSAPFLGYCKKCYEKNE